MLKSCGGWVVGGWVAYRILVSAPVPFWANWGWNWVGLGWDWVWGDWGLRGWGLGLDNCRSNLEWLCKCGYVHRVEQDMKGVEYALLAFVNEKSFRELSSPSPQPLSPQSPQTQSSDQNSLLN